MKKSDLVRQALKEIGYNSRQVSVKDRPGGMSYSFTLTIRDASVDYNKVEAVKNQFTSVDRCESSGEILSGGNTFVHISITDEVRTAWAAEFIQPLTDSIAQIVDESHGKKVNDRFIIFKHNDHVLKIWDEKKDNWMSCNYSINDLERMGVDMHIASFEPTAAPSPVAAPIEAPVTTPGQVQIIDYSEKAIAVIGDTKPIKEKLKELGGRFNARLTCGAGWIFRKIDLEKIQTALNS